MTGKIAAELKWVDAPPPDGRGASGAWTRWPEWLAEAKRRPGQWAHRSYASQRAASSVWSGVRRQYDVSNFEYTTRTLDDGTGALYFRYIAPTKRKRTAA